MAEQCAQCGASFSSATQLIEHTNERHGAVDREATLAMNPEASRAGLVCALCGKRFADRQALAQHNLSPHYRSNRPRAQVSAQRTPL